MHKPIPGHGRPSLITSRRISPSAAPAAIRSGTPGRVTSDLSTAADQSRLDSPGGRWPIEKSPDSAASLGRGRWSLATRGNFRQPAWMQKLAAGHRRSRRRRAGSLREALNPVPPQVADDARAGAGCDRCLKWVTGGKTPSEYMFSELPQVADIARSVFHHLANPSYCGSLRSGSEQFQAEHWSNNATRSSRIDWLWSAKRASVWVTGGSRCRSIRRTHSCASTSSAMTESGCAARRRPPPMTARLRSRQKK